MTAIASFVGASFQNLENADLYPPQWIIHILGGFTTRTPVPIGIIDPARAFSQATYPAAVKIGEKKHYSSDVSFHLFDFDTSDMRGEYLITREDRESGSSQITAYKMPHEGYQLGRKITFCTGMSMDGTGYGPKPQLGQRLDDITFARYTATIPPEPAVRKLEIGRKILVVEGMPMNLPAQPEGWTPSIATAEDAGIYAVWGCHTQMQPKIYSHDTTHERMVRVHLATRLGAHESMPRGIALVVKQTDFGQHNFPPNEMALIHAEDIMFAE